MRLPALAIALCLAALTLGACDSASRAGAKLSDSPARTSPPTRGGTIAAAPATTENPEIPGKVAIYARVPSPVVIADGRTFVAEIVLVNGLGRPFVVPDACNGWMLAGLASPQIAFEPAYTSIGCPGQTIAVGPTRLTRTVSTAYNGCTTDPHSITPDIPVCGGPSGQPPPLPAGTYHLQLDTSSIPNPLVPDPVIITLTHK